MRTFFLAVSCCLLISRSAMAGDAGDIAKQIETFLDKQVASDQFSGSVLVMKGNKPIIKKAYGLASKAYQAPNRPDTKFNLGSMNKMFTAVAILQLADQGKLGLSDSIIKHWPDYPNKTAAEKVTIHHLLTHTSGLSDYFGNEFMKSSRDRFRKIDDFLPLFVNKPLEFEPGKRFRYSNAGFMVLGGIVEHVSGQNYFDYVREHIYRPAGMNNTDCYELDQETPNLAVGYTRGRPGAGGKSKAWKNNIFLHVIKGGPAGGGYSTAEDLVAFATALRTHKLLSPKLTEVLWTGKVAVGRSGNAKYAYGFFDDKENGKRIVGHGGGFMGINSQLDIYLDSDYTVAVMSNYDPPAAQRIADELRKLICPKENATAANPATNLIPIALAARGDGGEGRAGSNQAGTDAPKRSWTLLMYGAVDNSADMPFISFLNQVRRAIDNDPGIELLVFIDRSEKHPKRKTFFGEDFTTTRLYRVRKDSVERVSGGEQFPEITADKDTKLNSADAGNVGKFIAWGKAHYPAQRYALMIYSHANGKTMCPVERTKDYMGIPELTEKVSAKERVDFLALELCNMGGIEIAYQWRPGNGGFETDVLLAIPNAGPPLDWDRAFARIRSPGHETKKGSAVDPASMTAADFGRLVIEEGYKGRQAHRQMIHESAGCYDLHRVAEVKKAVDALSVELARAKAKDVVLEVRGSGKDGVMYYSGDGTNVDLYDMCRRLASSDRLPGEVREAAKRVMQSVERFMIGSFGMSAYKGFESGKNGVYIVLPSGRPDCWKEFRWYTPTAGPGKIGRWSFLRDGATEGNGVVENWFELLDSWFDQSDGKGGINGYRP
jgi:clostripain